MKKLINKSKILFLVTLGIIILVASCTKDFDVINDDPNNPKDVPNSFYLAGAERGIMDNTCDSWWMGFVGNQLAQYWSTNQYTAESRYNFRTAVTNQYWTAFYAGRRNDAEIEVGGLLELKTIIDNCNNNPGLSSAYGFVNNQIAVATILRVWLIQNMTDTWGNIPYSEALQPDVTRTPKYDSQAAIYSGILGELNTALALISESESGPAGDLIYSGNMTLWKAFGNAIKMRIAIRMADRDNAGAQTIFLQAVAAGTFTSNADNAMFPYGTGSDANLMYYNRYVDGRNDFASSNIMIDILKSDSAAGHPVMDPRLPSYFAPATADTSWTGEVYGLTEGNAAATPNSSVSQRSALVLSATMPGIFLDYAQVEFMMAEAAERGWAVAGTAHSHYDAGITASIDFWTLLNEAPATQPEIDAYIAQPTVNYDSLIVAGQTWKQIIGKQKWIALYDQGVQGWTEWRRLDFGVLQLPADGVLDGTGIPVRMLYPIDEQTLNSGNYSAAVAEQGLDLQSTKVWWDVF